MRYRGRPGNPSARGIGIWALAFGIIAIAHWISAGAFAAGMAKLNALAGIGVVAGFALFSEGLRCEIDRRSPRLEWLAVLLSAPAMLYAGWGVADAALGIAIFSVASGAILIYLIWQLIPRCPNGRHSIRYLAILSTSILLAGVVGRLVLRDPAGEVLQPVPATVFLFAELLGYSGLTVAFSAFPGLRAEAALNEALDAAGSAARAKTEFLAMMSHDLRTPLNAIIGYSELLLHELDGPLVAKQKEHMSAIHSSGKLLTGLINDLLDLSKLEAGQYTLSRRPIVVAALLNECAVQTAPAAAEALVTVEVDIPDALPAFAGDERSLMQILNNIVSNAIKFSPPDGRVDLRARVEHGELVLEVEDHGEGMPQSTIETIGAAPFANSGNSYTARRHEGYGLGLYIVRRLLELYRGRLVIDSAVGLGTIVRVYLPIVELVANDPPSSENLGPESAPAGMVPPHLRLVGE
ncbi:MAG: HAMP domain-containing sensor histidine kinase [Alphaproteobacteria bacterium]